MSGWAENEDKIVRQCAGDGLSASQISAQLQDRSRNAVIGYCHRNKIPLESRKPREYSPAPKPRREKRAVNAPPEPTLKEQRKTENVLQLFRTGGKVLLLDAESDQCKWPCDGEPLRPMACGDPVFSGSYCKPHYRLAHR